MPHERQIYNSAIRWARSHRREQANPPFKLSYYLEEPLCIKYHTLQLSAIITIIKSLRLFIPNCSLIHTEIQAA